MVFACCLLAPFFVGSEVMNSLLSNEQFETSLEGTGHGPFRIKIVMKYVFDVLTKLSVFFFS